MVPHRVDTARVLSLLKLLRIIQAAGTQLSNEKLEAVIQHPVEDAGAFIAIIYSAWEDDIMKDLGKLQILSFEKFQADLSPRLLFIQKIGGEVASKALAQHYAAKQIWAFMLTQIQLEFVIEQMEQNGIRLVIQ